MSFENLDNSLTIASRIFQDKAYILQTVVLYQTSA